MSTRSTDPASLRQAYRVVQHRPKPRGRLGLGDQSVPCAVHNGSVRGFGLLLERPLADVTQTGRAMLTLDSGRMQGVSIPVLVRWQAPKHRARCKTGVQVAEPVPFMDPELQNRRRELRIPVLEDRGATAVVVTLHDHRYPGEITDICPAGMGVRFELGHPVKRGVCVMVTLSGEEPLRYEVQHTRALGRATRCGLRVCATDLARHQQLYRRTFSARDEAYATETWQMRDELVRFIQRRLRGDEGQAEEVFQQVYLFALQQWRQNASVATQLHPGTYGAARRLDVEQVRKWVFSITKYMVKTERSRFKRHLTLSDQEGVGAGLAGPYADAADLDDVRLARAYQDIRQRLHRWVERFHGEWAARLWFDAGWNETYDATATNRATVYRVRRRLRGVPIREVLGYLCCATDAQDAGRNLLTRLTPQTAGLSESAAQDLFRAAHLELRDDEEIASLMEHAHHLRYAPTTWRRRALQLLESPVLCDFLGFS